MKLANVLVFGPPRSGTTAIQGAICASLGSAFVPEANYLTDIFELYSRVAGFPDPLRFEFYLGHNRASELYGQLAKTMMDGLIAPEAGKVRVCKDPMMSIQFPRARQLLDDSTRVIAIVRHPADVMASMKRVRLTTSNSWDLDADLALVYRCYDGIRSMAQDPVAGEVVVRFEDLVAASGPALRTISDVIDAPLRLDREITPDWLSLTGAFSSRGYGHAITAGLTGLGHRSLDEVELERVQDVLAGMLQFWDYPRRSSVL